MRYIAFFILLLLACSTVLFLIYKDVEEKSIAQVNTEQMVHAAQAEQGIETFFSTYTNTVSFLAANRHIVRLDDEGQRLIREFYTTHSGEISSLTRVDENGTILYTYPYEASTGADISGQAHVQRSMASHTVVTSDVFTSVQGFRTIALVIPVFDNSTYRGSLSLLVPFDSLARRNLEPIRILSSGRAWMVSQSGTILYDPDPARIDRSAIGIYNHSPSVIAFLEDAMQGGSGISGYSIGMPETPGQYRIYEGVYRPVRVGDVHWTIIVATPRDEILEKLQTLQRDLAVIFCVLLISLIFFTYYILRAREIVREEEKSRAAEAALRESERKYRSIVENMQDIFYRADSDDTIIMISPSGIGHTGLASEQEILGRKTRSFYVHPEEHDALWEKIRNNGSVSNVEVQLRRADGSIITVLTNSHACYDNEGNFAGVEGIIRDITARKRADMALQLATRKLNLLTTITTTNIRNAAFTLSGYLELEQQQRTEAQRKEYHDRQVALVEQINRWLDIARNYQDLGLRPPIWHNVNTALILAISHLDFSKIQRVTDVNGLEIYADPMLETVFLNLAENVLLHGKTATVLSVRYETTPSGLVLIFEDNGVGIPDDLKAKIFRKEFSPVSGLGLFMAREILEITGITIHETGTFRKGARFELVVPKDGYRLGSEKTR